MMKKISIFLFAAAALLGAGCDDSSDTDKVIPVSAIALDTSLSGGISLVVGQTADIAGKVTVRPENATDKTETYESSDPETVSVDDAGVMKAVKPGLAMVTISVGGKHSHFEVEVREQRISVESVTLPAELADGVTLKLGATLDIAGKATIAPENASFKTETYTSSKPEVASISDAGEIKALTEGETTITVEADGIKATFSVKVEKGAVLITSIAFPESSKEVELGEPEAELDLQTLLTILPAEHTEGIVFTSSDPSVATVSENGKVTCLKAGETTVTAAAKNHPDVKAELTLTVCGDYDRTGWTMSATSHNLPTTPTKNSVTAAFDNDANGTSNFGQTRPGKNSGGVNLGTQSDIQIWFVVDLQSAHKINYFRIRHISTRQADYGTRWHKFVEILGSDTGEEGSWTSIATDVDFDSQSTVLANQETDNIRIPLSNYRYLKFVSDKNCFDTTGNTAQINELFIGRSKDTAGN